jgi:phosphate-selective porin OprO/OprP
MIVFVKIILLLCISFSSNAIELYVDEHTGQVFTSPGKHRNKLGDFEQKDTKVKSASISDIKESESKLNTRIDNIVNKPKKPTEMKGTMDDKGFRFESNDGQFKFAFNGRLHSDGDMFSGGDIATYIDKDKSGTYDPKKDGLIQNNRLTDGTEIRRLRMEFAGQFYEDWRFKLQPEIANAGANMTFGIRDAYIQYTGLGDYGQFFVGQSKQPYSLQQMMSSNDMVFMERSTEYEFTNRSVNRALGIRYDLPGKWWGFSTGLYGDTASTQASGTTSQGDEGWGASLRATMAPWMKSDELFHIGASAAFRAPATQNRTLNYRVAPTAINQVFYLNTGSMPDIQNSQFGNIEMAGVYGPLSLEAEYNATWFNSNDSATSGHELGKEILPGNGFFQGAHVDVAYSLTGESRATGYDAAQGVFRRIKPNQNLNFSDGWGAWELKSRFMWVDMNQVDNPLYQGGNQVATTFGVNWYFNNYARAMLDWTHVYSLDVGRAGINRQVLNVPGNTTGDWDYVQARVSLAF